VAFDVQEVIIARHEVVIFSRRTSSIASFTACLTSASPTVRFCSQLCSRRARISSRLWESFSTCQGGTTPTSGLPSTSRTYSSFFHVCPESLRQVADLANSELRSSESISLRPSWLLLSYSLECARPYTPIDLRVRGQLATMYTGLYPKFQY
jgi:hypothetical protein